jgi:signal peptidase I
MNPTLRAGDGLQVEPYEGKTIRVGDVVIFNSPEEDRKITHRVMSVNSKEIRTRGDNNKNTDPWVLSPESIIGRVICAQRGNRRKKVFAGTTGRLYAIVVRIIKVLDSRITLLLRPVYRWMMRIGILRKRMQPLIETQIISFDRPEGTELQLLMGRRVIGRLRPGKSQWQIRRPFRLFVDEERLPTR